jgi:hypothetical protein
MTPDSTNQRKRPRWFSPRRAVFWILALAVAIAATFAVLMFWPGLQYDWRSSDGGFLLVRYRMFGHVPHHRGDIFLLDSKWCGIHKWWDPDRVLPQRPSGLGLYTDRVILTLDDNEFSFWWTRP